MAEMIPESSWVFSFNLVVFILELKGIYFLPVNNSYYSETETGQKFPGCIHFYIHIVMLH